MRVCRFVVLAAVFILQQGQQSFALKNYNNFNNEGYVVSHTFESSVSGFKRGKDALGYLQQDAWEQALSYVRTYLNISSLDKKSIAVVDTIIDIKLLSLRYQNGEHVAMFEVYFDLNYLDYVVTSVVSVSGFSEDAFFAYFDLSDSYESWSVFRDLLEEHKIRYAIASSSSESLSYSIMLAFFDYDQISLSRLINELGMGFSLNNGTFRIYSKDSII